MIRLAARRDEKPPGSNRELNGRVINDFTVADNQQRLVDLLTRATDGSSIAPGFISTTVPRSIDGTK
jgi:hypothetical protein